jgi:3-methyl-2-oxobutanoate hydroxymethyltransferase
MVNLSFAPKSKFARRYADAAALFHAAIEHYREDVEHRAFPSDEESYHLPSAVKKELSESAEAPLKSRLHKV